MSFDDRSTALIDLLEELDESDLEYVLVGGYAVSAFDTGFSKKDRILRTIAARVATVVSTRVGSHEQLFDRLSNGSQIDADESRCLFEEPFGHRYYLTDHSVITVTYPCYRTISIEPTWKVSRKHPQEYVAPCSEAV